MTDENGSPLDRELQKTILLKLQSQYPKAVLFRPEANVRYLEDHGLCVESTVSIAGTTAGTGYYTISARGLDFLAADGGLSAILGVVTVRLHADTIRDLIGAKIESSPLPETEKSTFRKHLSSLPEAALRALTTDLAKQGLDHLPDAIHWLRTAFGL